MLQNLIDLSKISLEMQEHVNAVFVGAQSTKNQSMSDIKSLLTISESLIIKAETDLSNSFFLFIDKDDMMQFVSLLEETNNDLYKLANRRLLSNNLIPKHQFEHELNLQKQLLKEIDNVMNVLSAKYKFSELKASLSNLKEIRNNTDVKITDSIKNILTEQTYDSNGAQIWEREILQTFEDVFAKCYKFSNKLSEFIVKYE